MRTWILFAVMQTAIVGGAVAFWQFALVPQAESFGEPPPELHIAVGLGVLFALGATYAITDLSDWLARRRAARRDRNRQLKRSALGGLRSVESSHTGTKRRRLR